MPEITINELSKKDNSSTPVSMGSNNHSGNNRVFCMHAKPHTNTPIVSKSRFGYL